MAKCMFFTDHRNKKYSGSIPREMADILETRYGLTPRFGYTIIFDGEEEHFPTAEECRPK